MQLLRMQRLSPNSAPVGVTWPWHDSVALTVKMHSATYCTGVCIVRLWKWTKHTVKLTFYFGALIEMEYKGLYFSFKCSEVKVISRPNKNATEVKYRYSKTLFKCSADLLCWLYKSQEQLQSCHEHAITSTDNAIFGMDYPRKLLIWSQCETASPWRRRWSPLLAKLRVWS